MQGPCRNPVGTPTQQKLETSTNLLAKRLQGVVEKCKRQLPLFALLAGADTCTVGNDVGLHERQAMLLTEGPAVPAIKLANGMTTKGVHEALAGLQLCHAHGIQQLQRRLPDVALFTGTSRSENGRHAASLTQRRSTQDKG